MIEYRLKGLVQGVGFRPFVAELANKRSLSGTVKNTAGDVVIRIETGEAEAREFMSELLENLPAGSFVADIEKDIISGEKASDGFHIIKEEEENTGRKVCFVPADTGICDSCLKELFDRDNRRFHHPFISCSSCGVRYSVMDGMPYDRENTVMGQFELCEACDREYKRLYDRRHHAQTVCCKDCGPTLKFQWFNCEFDKIPKNGQAFGNDDALMSAFAVLGHGGILAIKDVGGYHLVVRVSPENTGKNSAIKALRALKHRERKPFAMMFPDVGEVKRFTGLTEVEEKILISPERPILLTEWKGGRPAAVDEALAGSPYIGAMLPAAPLQALLSGEFPMLIMTSANLSGDSLITRDDQMVEMMARFAEDCDIPLGVLSHDRDIMVPLDDPIISVVAGRRRVMRRGRGFSPLPLERITVFGDDERVFAAGGDLKASFAYLENGQVYMSPHIGDLEDTVSLKRYDESIESYRRLYGFSPERAAKDLHPAYHSSELIRERDIAEVQHHKAHVASVVAEHGLFGKVLGFAFDGTGVSPEGEIWGSEVFLWEDCRVRDGEKLRRIAHISENMLLLNDDSVNNVDRLLYGYLSGMNEADRDKILSYLINQDFFDRETCDVIYKAIRLGVASAKCTSMGRLFDAVSAMLDICHQATYEGEAAVLLEYEAFRADSSYDNRSKDLLSVNNSDDGMVWDTSELFRGLCDMLLQGRKKAFIARDFIFACCGFICVVSDRYPEYNVVLSGGTFGNRILTESVTEELSSRGRNVFINEQVPCGDGGLALGQLYLSKGDISD